MLPGVLLQGGAHFFEFGLRHYSPRFPRERGPCEPQDCEVRQRSHGRGSSRDRVEAAHFAQEFGCCCDDLRKVVEGFLRRRFSGRRDIFLEIAVSQVVITSR